MSFAEHYFGRQKLFRPIIEDIPPANLSYVIVMVATREEDLVSSVTSICKCQPPVGKAELIVLINGASGAPDAIKEINRKAFQKLKDYISSNQSDWLQIFPILKNDLPNRYAGVGLARKIGMDEALWRFHQIDKPNGIIISFDADATCDPDFLVAIENHFINYPETTGCSIYFEHDIDVSLYPEDQRIAISSYEMHLRYYKLALRYAGFPFSFHTIGSSFVVKATSYARQGGMNRNKAGEDFYFLQKIIPLGNYHELNSTRILLSPRVSDRVPFGTGAAMKKMLESGKQVFETYNFAAFLDLKKFFSLVNGFYKCDSKTFSEHMRACPASIIEFLEGSNFEAGIKEMNENATTPESFSKRFFQWWSAFRVLKFLNHSHYVRFRRTEPATEAKLLLEQLDIALSNKEGIFEILNVLRNYERRNPA